MNNFLKSETEYLYNRNFLGELDGTIETTEEEDEEYEIRSENLIKTYGWDKVFAVWEDYLYHQCRTVNDVLNFANLFWCYEGHKHYIAKPYKFLGYFYYRMDLNPFKYDAIDLMDSIVIDILEKTGETYVNLVNFPDYAPEKDKKIIAEVQKWKSGKYK